MTENKDQPLSPTAFTPASELPGVESAPPPPRLRGWLPAGLGLFALLWVVVFFLPQWVEQTGSTEPSMTTTEANRAASAPVSEQPGATTAPPDAITDSPFADAQLARMRREAQDILQPLLDLQSFLQARGVESWAGDAFNAATAQALAGDEAYRARDFEAATAAYNGAFDALEALDQQLPEQIARQTRRLIAALEALDQSGANQALDLLKVLAPDDPEIATMDHRVMALPAVSEALDTAAASAASDDIDGAVTAAQQAVAADAEHQLAAQTLADYRERQRVRNFQQAMSAGYAALSEAAFETAEARFKTAGRLSPGAPEPADALVELAAARTAARLRKLRDEAAALEADEQWADAQARYQSALETDPTLVFATEGLARVEPRATIGVAIRGIMEAPERLVDSNALREAQQVLADLDQLGDSGPRFQRTRTELAALLEAATTPIRVTLVSDGVTDVTIARVRRLGTFAEQAITLRPGRYTAVGIRNGYRDVRVSFEVGKGASGEPVDVRCTEAL